MKTTATPQPDTAKPTYPYLGIDPSKVIVLFYEPGKGVALTEGNALAIKPGLHSNSWLEHYFNPYTGTVTLSND